MDQPQDHGSWQSRTTQAHDQAPESALPLIGRLQQRPLVGRERECALLHQHLLATEHGVPVLPELHQPVGQATLDEGALTSTCIAGFTLFGEAGIGKTRLAEEAAREALSRGWNVLWNRIYSQESHIPYRLWIEVLRNIWQQDLWPNMSASAQHYQHLVTLLPEIAASLPPPAVQATLSREQELLHLWEAILLLVQEVSARAPLLIVLDDLQWIDLSSAELLGYLLRRLGPARVLLLATCRDTDLPTTHPLRSLMTALQHEDVIATLQVPVLTEEQIRTLVSDMPDPQARHIQHQAAGNPFFAEELARVFWLEGGQTNSETSGLQQHALPQTITTVLNQRLGRLSLACQQLLSHAAVLGDALSFTTLHLLESTAARPCDEDQLRALINEALEAAVLMETHEGTQCSYHFWHPLIISHLYDGLSATRRARLHLRAAKVLRQVYSERLEEIAALLTHHLIQAGADALEIIQSATLAADRAYSLCAFPDAERHYRIVLEQSGTGNPAMALLTADDLNRLMCLYEHLGECTRNQGKFETARTFYEQALKLHQQYHASQSTQFDPRESQIQALLWSEIGVTWYDRGNFVQARQCYRYGEEVLQRAGVTTGPASAYLLFQQSFVSFREGDYARARQGAHEALHLFEDVLTHTTPVTTRSLTLTRTLRVLAGDPINLGRTHALLGVVAGGAGHSMEAFYHLNAALALYERYDYQREIAIVCCNLGDLYLRKADHVRAEAFFLRSLRISEHMGEIPFIAIALGNLGVLTLHVGDLAQAEHWLRRGVALTERFDEPIYASILRTYLAIVLQEQGRLHESRVILHIALSIARAAHIAPSTSLALVTLGSMRVRQALVANVEAIEVNSINNVEGTSVKAEDLNIIEVRSSRSIVSAYGYLHTAENRERILKQAQKTLQHALMLKWIEAETRTEGELIQADVLLLLGETSQACQLITQIQVNIQKYELFWMQPRALRVMGCLCASQEQYVQAERYLEQALDAARSHGMRLEEARILQCYGSVLLQSSGADHASRQEANQRGREAIQKALQLFTSCHAQLDVQVTRQLLLACSNTMNPEAIAS